MIAKLSALGRWCLYWLILPNIFIIMMWPIGGPPMKGTIIVVGAMAILLSRFQKLAIRRMGVLTLLSISSFQYVLSSFNLDNVRTPALAEFVQHARPLDSLTYLAAAFTLVLAAGVAVRGVEHAPRLGRAVQMLVGFAATLLFAQADTFATAATSNSYRRLPTRHIEVESGTMAAGLVRPPSDQRHTVIILVEALGVPVAVDALRQFRQDWARPEWHGPYEVKYGKIPFYGSTINGALRELCLVYSKVEELNFAKADCLPRRYGRAGYQTAGFHGFEGGFFERTTWWPKAGFAKMAFAPELVRQGARRCGGMWPGACDVDIAAIIGQRLIAAKQPQFIYWITLNSHIPVLEGAASGLERCGDGTAPMANKSQAECRLFLAHHEVADAISRLLLNPRLPPTDFLIVGDHMPPFLSRRERLDFDGYNVPWISLHRRPPPEQGAPVGLHRPS